MVSTRATLIACAAVVLSACSASDVIGPSPIRQSSINTLSGCYDPVDPQCSHTPPAGDPNPSAPGVYLGSGFTPSACTGVSINDVDNDDFDDFCEFQLALAFRPLLSTNPYDEDLSREPYWAATWNAANNEVWMMYMPAYHFDNGNQHADVCQGSNHAYCWGHFGDSEYIYLRARYNASTQHWALYDATLSAHWLESCPWLPLTHCDYTTMYIADNMEYPTKAYHYPRIYVSLDKHANYNTRGNCNDGGAYHSDDCTDNADDSRITVNRYKNVGETWAPMITSTTSSSPIEFSGTEYFSNNFAFTPFCGWDGPSVYNRNNCSTSYEYVLYYYAF